VIVDLQQALLKNVNNFCRACVNLFTRLPNSDQDDFSRISPFYVIASGLIEV
jgi:hypothetical protein